MAADAAVFFEQFFRELTRRGVPFVILHGYDQMPEVMPSDIDFAVHCHDLPKLLPIQREIADRQGWRLVSVVRAKLFALYTVFVNAQDPTQFIQLDACGHYVERGQFLFRDEQLLAGATAFRFFSIPAPKVEFGYVLAKSLVKKQPLERHLPRLRTLFDADREGASTMFKSLTGEELELWFARPATQWDEVLPPLLRDRTPLGLLNSLRECGRAVSRIASPVGFHVVLLGSDGSGKSTLISRLGVLGCFRRQKLFHFRPHVFDNKEAGPPVTRPHAQTPRSQVFCIFKTLYYFVDHLIGYWTRILPARVRNELVIFDRSFSDLLVDPRRYRMARIGGLARLLNKLLPRADLTIVLDAEPEVIHARKPELSLDELARQRAVLRELAKVTPCSVVVFTGQPAERVEHIVRLAILTFLAERERERSVN